MAALNFYPNAETILNWLNNDAGKQVIHVAGSWYSREGPGQPCRRHSSLQEAAVFAMDQEKQKEERGV